MNQKGKNTETYITWDEWNMYVAKNTCSLESAISDDKLSQPEPCDNPFYSQKLFERFKNAGNPTLSMSFLNGSILAANLPHLHMTQYLTSVWLHPTQVLAKEDVNKLFNNKHPFFSIYSPVENDEKIIEPFKSNPDFKLIREDWHVVWTCHRKLLPMFLQNSLRSLEIMNKKYGDKNVA